MERMKPEARSARSIPLLYKTRTTMNNIFKFIGRVAFGVALLASCSPDDFTSPNGNVPLAADYEDNVTVTVDQETNYAIFHFDAAPGVTPVWFVDGRPINSNFTARRYYRKAGTYTVECRVKNANGMSDGSIVREFTVDKTVMIGFGGFDSESDKNLFKNATVTQAKGYYAPGWSQIADPYVSMNDNGFTVNLPQETTDQWQCQIPLETDICTTADPNVTYDFSVILTSSTDHKGVTVKLTNPYNDGDFYFQERPALKAGEPYCFYITNLPSRSIDNLKLFFDFGGNAANTDISVENITFIKTSDNEVEAPSTDPEPVWVDIDSDENLWNIANPKFTTGYYAPGWNQIADPVVTINGREYSFILPQATFERWQAQIPFETTLGISDTSIEYDFLAIIESSEEMTAMVKLTDASDDNNYFFADETKLVAGAETRVVKQKVTLGNACEALKLFFDFGGNPANTEIKIKDIILQVHKD